MSMLSWVQYPRVRPREARKASLLKVSLVTSGGGGGEQLRAWWLEPQALALLEFLGSEPGSGPPENEYFLVPTGPKAPNP